MNDLAIIVLAAGLGTRMRSDLPKVMHRAAGRSLLGHVLTAAKALDPARVIIVCGSGKEDLAAESCTYIPKSVTVTQAARRGTGHAVSVAEPALEGFRGTVLVLYGDVPLIEPETLRMLVAGVSAECLLTVLGFEPPDPHGYGRLIRNDANHVIAIREELDATPEERRLTLCNSGILAAQAELLWRLLPRVKSNNAKGEIYLTDVIALAEASGARVGLVTCEEREVRGVNTRRQLAIIESLLQERYRASAMDNGATLIAPETVFFSADTAVGRDVIIEPHVIFGPGVRIADSVHILGFSHIEGATIATGARIGPFARLRPGAAIGEDAHIGNFVEVKKAVIERGAKANHLTYIGDARVGARSNIGAGTITANYDGYDKHHTDIGAGVSVGSNVVLIAPVKVGDGANVGAGSVVTADVEPEALALARADLMIKPGWAARYRGMKEARRKAKKKS